MLPLFHGHGLNRHSAGLAGGRCERRVHTRVQCQQFLWVANRFRPTWYSAVPTMHQAILAQARYHRERAADYRLRFVRSASAPLPPRIYAELEQTFETPMIEFYGMTETASAPIACNPLPPRQRKPGSVGVPVGLDVAIMGERGAFLPRGQTGQIVVRGATVTRGYDGDPMANGPPLQVIGSRPGTVVFSTKMGTCFSSAAARRSSIAAERRLPRGKSTMSSWSIPAVAEAVTFAVPHPDLGEDVASAVVLRPEVAATSKDIRQFVIGRIADFKVPRQVLVVDELPKSPTGKVQRVGLAEKLGLSSRTATPQNFVAPRRPLEKMLAETLGRGPSSRTDRHP